MLIGTKEIKKKSDFLILNFNLFEVEFEFEKDIKEYMKSEIEINNKIYLFENTNNIINELEHLIKYYLKKTKNILSEQEIKELKYNDMYINKEISFDEFYKFSDIFIKIIIKDELKKFYNKYLFIEKYKINTRK